MLVNLVPQRHDAGVNFPRLVAMTGIALRLFRIALAPEFGTVVAAPLVTLVAVLLDERHPARRFCRRMQARLS